MIQSIGDIFGRMQGTFCEGGGGGGVQGYSAMCRMVKGQAPKGILGGKCPPSKTKTTLCVQCCMLSSMHECQTKNYMYV